jgi:hypothetical protein
MSNTTSPRLSPAQVEKFRAEGYLIADEPVFTAEKFGRLKDSFETLLAGWPFDKRPEAINVPHFKNNHLLEWALAPEVLDLVEPLTGPDILLFSTHFICKPQGDGRRVPWHEDSAYWKKHLDHPEEVVTIWLAIDPSTLANGCMHVIPHTHNTGRKGFSDYDDVDLSKNVFSTEITPSQRDEKLAVPIELQPNHCSLHDARIMHGSAPNTSDIRRCGWTLRFMPASVKLNEAICGVQLIYQARGRNLAGQTLADPKVSYGDPTEAFKAHGIKSH